MLLTVVVPCHNEKPNILRFERELMPTLEGLGLPFEVLAVDDGSTDGSAQVLRELSARLPKFRWISLPENRGLGAALRAGFAQAQGDWIATLDADLTFSPVQLKTLWDRKEKTGADMIGGSPFLAGGSATGVPWSRVLPSLLLNAFYRGLFDRRLTAYTPLFRLYRASSLKALPLASEGFEINAEIAARFIRARRPVAEAPVVLTQRCHGSSKLDRFRELKRHAALILRLLSAQS